MLLTFTQWQCFFDVQRTRPRRKTVNEKKERNKKQARKYRFRTYSGSTGAAVLGLPHRLVRPAAQLFAHLADGALQPALWLLHAGPGCRPDADRAAAHRRRDRPHRRPLRRRGRRQDPPDRRRADRSCRHRRHHPYAEDETKIELNQLSR